MLIDLWISYDINIFIRLSNKGYKIGCFDLFNIWYIFIVGKIIVRII